MRSFIFGVIVGVVILIVLGYLYFMMGMAPAAATAKPMPFERTLAHGALHAWVDREMPKNVQIQADETNYLAGAAIYREHCAVCHGTQSAEPTAIAKGMFPRPPQLFKGHGVTDDPPGETYWKVANGIRLTGMPAFNHSLSETQMWQVSVMLADADKISDVVKQALVAQASASPMAAPDKKPAK